jgi:signal transduction histidine kinase
MNLTRIIITDAEAVVLYDSSIMSDTLGKIALYYEITQALADKDVFYSAFSGGAFISRAAMPIMNKNNRIGAAYIYEYDTEQGSLILVIQKNLINISYAIGGISILLAFVFSNMLTGRIKSILRAIKIVREGGYGYQVPVRGRDEMADLGKEFNSLTERLKKTDEIRRRFVSDASHELKTPLAAIRLLTDSIVQNAGMDEGTVREFVDDIGREAERLTRITEKLLTLTRLDSVAVEARAPLDVKKVVEEALKMLQPLAASRSVRLEWSLGERCFIRAAADDIHQVVFNLVENGIKYNVEDGFVRVLLYRAETSVFLLVDDQGIGIPKEDLPHVFDRFYRVDKARSREAGGSGIGLSIVRDTVLKHGGTVEVLPREPGGTRFQLGFPACEGEAS